MQNPSPRGWGFRLWGKPSSRQRVMPTGVGERRAANIGDFRDREVIGISSWRRYIARDTTPSPRRLILTIMMDGPAKALADNKDVKEFYLGMSSEGSKSFRDMKSYRRRKRWV